MEKKNDKKMAKMTKMGKIVKMDKIGKSLKYFFKIT